MIRRTPAQRGWADRVRAVGHADTDIRAVGYADADPATLEATLVGFSKEHLSGYKCPKRVVAVDAIHRGPNGKADYRWGQEVAAAAVDATNGR